MNINEKKCWEMTTVILADIAVIAGIYSEDTAKKIGKLTEMVKKIPDRPDQQIIYKEAYEPPIFLWVVTSKQGIETEFMGTIERLAEIVKDFHSVSVKGEIRTGE